MTTYWACPVCHYSAGSDKDLTRTAKSCPVCHALMRLAYAYDCGDFRLLVTLS